MTTIRDTKDLGAFIRRMRKARGYTQGQLAELAGVGVVYISQLENGKETAEIGKALRLLQLLSVDLEVIDRQNPMDRDALSDDSPSTEPLDPGIPLDDLYIALPALLGEDGQAHIASVDQAFWHQFRNHRAPERPVDDE